jgi:hypothetical protein
MGRFSGVIYEREIPPPQKLAREKRDWNAPLDSGLIHPPFSYTYYPPSGLQAAPLVWRQNKTAPFRRGGFVLFTLTLEVVPCMNDGDKRLNRGVEMDAPFHANTRREIFQLGWLFAFSWSFIHTLCYLACREWL